MWNESEEIKKEDFDMSNFEAKVLKKFLPILNEKSKYQLIYGPSASGKSYFVAQRLIYEMMTNPGRNWLVVRKIGRTIKQSVYAQIISVIADLKVSDMFYVNERMNITHMNGSGVVFIGMDNTESLHLIQGIKNDSLWAINAIWIEEATELTKDDFNELDIMLGSGGNNFLMMTFSDYFENSWIKEMFFSGNTKNICLLKTELEDNIHIVDSRLIDEINELTGNTYRFDPKIYGEAKIYGEDFLQKQMTEDEFKNFIRFGMSEDEFEAFIKNKL